MFLRSWANGSLISCLITVFSATRRNALSIHIFTWQSHMLRSFTPFTRVVTKPCWHANPKSQTLIYERDPYIFVYEVFFFPKWIFSFCLETLKKETKEKGFCSAISFFMKVSVSKVRGVWAVLNPNWVTETIFEVQDPKPNNPVAFTAPKLDRLAQPQTPICFYEVAPTPCIGKHKP